MNEVIRAILPADTSSTCNPHGSCPPAGLTRYCPKPGRPFTRTGSNREPRQPLPTPSIHAAMSADPLSHIANGGIDCVASVCSSATRASMS